MMQRYIYLLIFLGMSVFTLCGRGDRDTTAIDSIAKPANQHFVLAKHLGTKERYFVSQTLLPLSTAFYLTDSALYVRSRSSDIITLVLNKEVNGKPEEPDSTAAVDLRFGSGLFIENIDSNQIVSRLTGTDPVFQAELYYPISRITPGLLDSGLVIQDKLDTLTFRLNIDPEELPTIVFNDSISAHPGILLSTLSDVVSDTLSRQDRLNVLNQFIQSVNQRAAVLHQFLGNTWEEAQLIAGRDSSGRASLRYYLLNQGTAQLTVYPNAPFVSSASISTLPQSSPPVTGTTNGTELVPTPEPEPWKALFASNLLPYTIGALGAIVFLLTLLPILWSSGRRQLNKQQADFNKERNDLRSARDEALSNQEAALQKINSLQNQVDELQREQENAVQSINKALKEAPLPELAENSEPEAGFELAAGSKLTDGIQLLQVRHQRHLENLRKRVTRELENKFEAQLAAAIQTEPPATTTKPAFSIPYPQRFVTDLEASVQWIEERRKDMHPESPFFDKFGFLLKGMDGRSGLRGLHRQLTETPEMWYTAFLDRSFRDTVLQFVRLSGYPFFPSIAAIYDQDGMPVAELQMWCTEFVEGLKTHANIEVNTVRIGKDIYDPEMAGNTSVKGSERRGEILSMANGRFKGILAHLPKGTIYDIVDIGLHYNQDYLNFQGERNLAEWRTTTVNFKKLDS